MREGITLAETKQARVDLEIAIRDALSQFTATTGIAIGNIYVRHVEMLGDDGKKPPRYTVEAEVRL